MTTQTEITTPNHVVAIPSKIKPNVWPLILIAILILAVVGAVVLVSPPKAEVVSGNTRALDAMSARYQGLAEVHAANNPVSVGSLEASTARYDGMVEAFSFEGVSGLEAGRLASAARYQGLAEVHVTGEVASPEVYWSTTAARYQALADDFARKEAQVEAYWTATAARYQALAEDFAGKEAMLANYWTTTAARYQGMADSILAEQAEGLKAGRIASAARYDGLAGVHGIAPLEGNWTASAARLGAMADDFAGKEVQMERILSANATRYQGMAEAFLIKGGIEQGWTATGARYQAMAEGHLTK